MQSDFFQNFDFQDIFFIFFLHFLAILFFIMNWVIKQKRKNKEKGTKNTRVTFLKF